MKSILNKKCKKKKLIYHLTNRGTYSEFNNLLIFSLLARRLGVSFAIDDRGWRGSSKEGFSDFFECSNIDVDRTGPIVNSLFLNTATGRGAFSNRLSMVFQYIKRVYIRKYLSIFFPENYYAINLWLQSRLIRYVPYLSSGGEVVSPFDTLRELNEKLFHYNEQVRNYISDSRVSVMSVLGSRFLACHLRRGDKVGREMGYIPLEVYAKKIIESGIESILICTDSYSDYLGLCSFLPENYKVFSFADVNCQGFSERKFRLTVGDSKYNQMLKLFAEVELMVGSEFFIGTYSSCMGQYIGLRRGLVNSCSVDNHWCIE